MQEFEFRNVKGWLSGKLNIHDDVTIIIGPNGSGKTTLLQEMYEKLPDCVFNYNNSNYGYSSRTGIQTWFEKSIALLDLSKKLEVEPWHGGIKYTMNFDMLSDGEKYAFSMLSLLTDLRDNRNMILYDLPETYLHIEWQEKLVDIFLEYCHITGNRIVLTTHSPHILNGHFDLVEADWANPEENES